MTEQTEAASAVSDESQRLLDNIDEMRKAARACAWQASFIDAFDELAAFLRERDELRALLAEAGEHLQHAPGDCWIAIGEIKPCNCGMDDFDVRRRAALHTASKL
jgi:hypothetical protein